MKLDEFLLARIAEDEAQVDGIHQGEGDPDFFWGPGRIREECEVKRRIVERCAPYLDPFSHTSDRACTAEYELAEETLLNLASVYADHADYRDEWRP